MAVKKTLAAACLTDDNKKAEGRKTFVAETVKYHRLNITVDGEVFETAAQLAKHLGVKPSRVRRPLRKGHSVESVVKSIRG